MMLRLLLLLSLIWPATGAPQDGLPTTVKEIRQLYANVQQAIADMNEEEHYRSQLVTTIQRTLPVTGIRKETVTTYFAEYDEGIEEGDFNPDYRPYFITRKFSNEAGWKGYEEYLYDDESGQPVFVFLQIDYNDGKGKQETRYYYGPLGLISENIKGERVMDEGAAHDQATTLWDSLKAQLNQFEQLAL